ncbi:hypothetical protein EVAR_56950_1 [Eumeta japonica]|uniref:Uncharacterized protein n=1 Tax=Eumeta variegata TaxID=151549 RepID=A0A4C1YQP8_EUMVA|nr:hypothetical protein EVAR_56950_1 [Eumeta japonica]
MLHRTQSIFVRLTVVGRFSRGPASTPNGRTTARRKCSAYPSSSSSVCADVHQTTKRAVKCAERRSCNIFFSRGNLTVSTTGSCSCSFDNSRGVAILFRRGRAERCVRVALRSRLMLSLRPLPRRDHEYRGPSDSDFARMPHNPARAPRRPTRCTARASSYDRTLSRPAR